MPMRNYSFLGGQAKIVRSPAIIGTRAFEGTLRSTFKETPGRSRQIAWTGASAAAHMIPSIEGYSYVKANSVQAHFSWNLGYVGGTAKCGSRTEIYGNKPRYAYVVPPGSELEFELEKSNFNLLTTEFGQHFLLRSCELDQVEIVPTWDYNHSVSWALAELLFEECADEAPQGLLYSETAMMLLALHLVRALSTQVQKLKVTRRGGLSSTLLRRARDYMIHRLSDDVSLQEVAAVTGLSVGHFSFAFRSSLGIAPHAWLRGQRIERAKVLLCDPKHSLATIALAVGYANQSAFGVAFKRETGLTPTEWKRAL